MTWALTLVALNGNMLYSLIDHFGASFRIYCLTSKIFTESVMMISLVCFDFKKKNLFSYFNSYFQNAENWLGFGSSLRFLWHLWIWIYILHFSFLLVFFMGTSGSLILGRGKRIFLFIRLFLLWIGSLNSWGER